VGWFERPEFGANVGLIDEIYRQYLDNPESVSPAWRDFFAENEPGDDGAEATAEDTAEGREAPPAAEPAQAVDDQEHAASGSATPPHRGTRPRRVGVERARVPGREPGQAS
jgi:2-oxoglutarate decarboxylase